MKLNEVVDNLTHAREQLTADLEKHLELHDSRVSVDFYNGADRKKYGTIRIVPPVGDDDEMEFFKGMAERVVRATLKRELPTYDVIRTAMLPSKDVVVINVQRS